MLTKNFQQLSKSDAQIAGGKGASLGEMTNAGIPVPPGFVVLPDAFEQFLAETDLNVEIEAILKTVDNQKMHTVENASEEIQALILQAKMPEDIAKEIQENFKKLDAKFVAVRSSATAEDGAEAAWAGQLDSYLNTNQEALLENVQRCWASLFTPRAIFYRFEKKLHKQKISVAVVVQKMIQSEISGIAFSVHPVTEDYNQMIIEAGFGLGEAIVSGSITPDAYVVSKNPRKIEDINISQQSKGLFQKESGGNVWQDIPEKEGKKQKLSKKQILELSDLIIKIEDHYQFPVDIEWAYENKKFYIVQSRPITTLINKSTNDSTENPLEDVSQWRLWGKWKFPIFSNVAYNTYSLRPVFKKLHLPADFKGNAVNADGYVYAFKKDHEIFDEFIRDVFRNNHAWFYNFFALCEDTFDRAERMKENNDIVRCMEVFADSACLTMIIHFCDKGLEMIVPEVAIASGFDSTTFSKLLVPHSSTYMMQYKDALRKLKKKDMQKFLNEFGWVGASFLNGERLTEADVEHELQNLPEKEKHADIDFSALNKHIKAQIEILQKLIYYRSINAEINNKIINSQWEALDALAERYGHVRNDFNVASPEEITTLFLGGKLPADFQKRLDEKGLDKSGLSFIDGEFKLYFGKSLKEMLKVFKPSPANSEGDISGTSAYKGKANGVVRIVENTNDLKKIQTGDIIVSPETMPDYIVGMKKAAAFVTDQGGITSHAAIVARELKKPCIIGTKIATQVLHDGDLVEVDANEGVVRILRRNSSEESGIVFNKKYERVFGGPDMSFLISDIITDVYAPKYGFVTIYRDSIWTCYMPIEEKNKTLTEGAELYENVERYVEFRSEYLKFIDAYDKHFREIFNPNKVITKEIFESLIDLFKKAESYYAYTQYFYTDGISQINKEFEAEFGTLKEKGRELLNRQYFSGNNYLNEVLEAVSRITAIKKDELYDYAWQDVSLLWKNNDVRKNIHKWKTYVTYPIDGSKRTFFESEALEIIDQFLLDHKNHREILSGTVANKGKVVGNAYVLDKGYDHKNIGKFIDEMEKGAILITETTSPEIMTACKKASAIVANQGGLMSHAAIVSRELDIPCIVGLEGATEIIENGDLVEVDANKGIVRILEKAKSNEYFKFKFPAYRYFMANKLIPTFKYEDVYLWGEIFGEYSPEGMHKTCTNKNVLLEPGKKLFELLKEGDQKLEKELLAIVNEIIPLAKELQAVILKDKLTGHVSDLNDFFPNYEKVFNKALAFGYSLDYAIDEYLKKDASLSENLQSPYSSFLMEEEYELYKIFSKKYKKPELTKALERHLAKYAWIKSDYQGENVLTVDDLYAKEARLMDAKPEKTKSVGGKISAPKNLQEWISLLIYLRDVRKKVGMIGVVLLDRYLKQECQKLKKDYAKARLLSVAEFERYKNKKLPEYPDKRNERMSPDGIEIIPNEKWQKYPFNQEVVVGKEKLLTGVVANKGKVKGIARIIIGKHDFHKMGKGEIIVASMTRPEFMPILRKASAILTEQGGITCHAAIISRELGVPCIIGIENLTAILKDGDLVEVDADNGVVRILK